MQFKSTTEYLVLTDFFFIYVFRCFGRACSCQPIKSRNCQKHIYQQNPLPAIKYSVISNDSRQFDCYVFIIGNLSSFGFPKRPEISNKWANLLLLLSKAVTENCNGVCWRESKSIMVALTEFSSSTSDTYLQ